MPAGQSVSGLSWRDRFTTQSCGRLRWAACWWALHTLCSACAGNWAWAWRAVSDLKKSAAAHKATSRTERDLNAKVVFAGVGVVLLAMIGLYYYFIAGAHNLTGTQIMAGAVVAAVVMIVLGFFFAAVSGNLVGMIGSSNNPVSGLTLCTLVVAALLMVALGVSGAGGVAAVLGVAAIVCVSSAVAGEMLQDLKVRTHTGRYAIEDADRRHVGSGRGVARAVFPIDDSG